MTHKTPLLAYEAHPHSLSAIMLRYSVWSMVQPVSSAALLYLPVAGSIHSDISLGDSMTDDDNDDDCTNKLSFFATDTMVKIFKT